MPFQASADVMLFCACDESQDKQIDQVGGEPSFLRFQPWKLWARVSGSDVPIPTLLSHVMEASPTAYYDQVEGKWFIHFTAGMWDGLGMMRFSLFRITTEDWQSFSAPRFVSGIPIRAGYASPSYMAFSIMGPVGNELKLVCVEKQSGRRVGAKAAPLVRAMTTSFLAEDERKIIIGGREFCKLEPFTIMMDLRDGVSSEILVDGSPVAEASIFGEVAAYSAQVGDESWQRDIVSAPFSLAEPSVSFSLVDRW
jgi:hypothetical protein